MNNEESMERLKAANPYSHVSVTPTVAKAARFEEITMEKKLYEKETTRYDARLPNNKSRFPKKGIAFALAFLFVMIGVGVFAVQNLDKAEEEISTANNQNDSQVEEAGTSESDETAKGNGTSESETTVKTEDVKSLEGMTLSEEWQSGENRIGHDFEVVGADGDVIYASTRPYPDEGDMLPYKLMKTSDGLEWEEIQEGKQATFEEGEDFLHLNGVIYSAVVENKQLVFSSSSDEGQTWKEISTVELEASSDWQRPERTTPNSIVHLDSNGSSMLIDIDFMGKNQSFVSADLGQSWESTELPNGIITTYEDQFVIYEGSGILRALVSSDGLEWGEATNWLADKDKKYIGSSDTLLVAEPNTCVGSCEEVLTISKDDGETWTDVRFDSILEGEDHPPFTYDGEDSMGGGLFTKFTVGPAGIAGQITIDSEAYMVASLDGESWKVRSLAESTELDFATILPYAGESYLGFAIVAPDGPGYFSTATKSFVTKLVVEE